jgi:glycosyltransferase involved in cell wall biosynthesis
MLSLRYLFKLGSSLKIISASCRKKTFPYSGNSFNHLEIKNGLTLGDNRNRGNQVVTGDIIVCMDDDDYYPPTRISHAVEELNKSNFLYDIYFIN